MKATNVKVPGDTSPAMAYMGNMRTNRNTPAETMVAAWMSALTGVGPSMASGNHTCNGNCALLPTVPKKMSTEVNATTGTVRPRNGMWTMVLARCSRFSSESTSRKARVLGSL